MANAFQRFPINGGDDGVWAVPLLESVRGAIPGQYTCQLSDNGGNLELSKGLIGIQDGTNEGVSIIDTVVTINMAGVANGNWAQIEMAVAGVGVTFTATTIAGATDETTLPATFTGAYNSEKQSFYINATKKTIGLAWKNSGGTLEGIVNAKAFINGYNGYSISDDGYDLKYAFENYNVDLTNFVSSKYVHFQTSAGVDSVVKHNPLVREIGGWDMDADNKIIIDLGIDMEKIRTINVIIRGDNVNVDYTPLYRGGHWNYNVLGNGSATRIGLIRDAAGIFDSPSHNDAGINRGWIYIEYED